MNNNYFDTAVSFHIDNGAFRGRIIRLSNCLDILLNKHKYSLPVSGVIAESTALATALASSLKYDGLFTLQTKTNGPIPMVVVDVTSEGEIRSYAKADQEWIDKSQTKRKALGEIEPAPHLMGLGHLAFTVDQGKNTQLYQGIVELKGNTLADCALKYFKQSEQIDTALKIFIEAPKKGETFGWKAFAIMLQKMPTTGGKIKKTTSKEEMDAAWEEAKIFMDSITKEEAFNKTISPEELAHRLYHSNQLQFDNIKNYKFKCRCSKDKLLTTLQSFSDKEINEVADEKGQIVVDCNFCAEKYVFDKGELIKQ